MDTSSNLGMGELKIDTLNIRVLSRNANEECLKHIQLKLETAEKDANADFKTIFSVPSWEHRLDSGMLVQSKKVYEKLLQTDPVVSIIHGGLECSWVAEKRADIDMIAIEPTIENTHSPNERLDLKSVKQNWDFMVALLESSKKIDEENREENPV